MLRIEMYKNRVEIKGNTYYISGDIVDELLEIAKDMVEDEIEYENMQGVAGREINEMLEDTFEGCILNYLREVA